MEVPSDLVQIRELGAAWSVEKDVSRDHVGVREPWDLAL